MKILILSSNPRKDLNLDDEIRDLQDVIEKSRNRQEFEVEIAPAVRVGDLQDLFFRHRPQIVHFCGHGSGQQGLVFKGKDGGEQWVRAEALSDLFRLFSTNVGCVLLNACYSEEQANAIVNHIDYVIGMNQEIRDDAAIAFSKGFYRALGYECSIEQAYEFGKNAIQLEISGSSRMRSSGAPQSEPVPTEEVVRKAEVIGVIERTAIPEHLKPILKIKPALARSSKANIAPLEEPLSPESRDAIRIDIAGFVEADIYPTIPPEVPEPIDEIVLSTLLRNKLIDWRKIESPLPEDVAKTRVELVRQYEFKAFLDAIAFMAKVAPDCEFALHHPRWENNWRTIKVYLTTWDIGHRISDRDTQLAKAFEQVFSRISRDNQSEVSSALSWESINPISDEMLDKALKNNLSQWKKVVSPLTEHTVKSLVENSRQQKFKSPLDALKFAREALPKYRELIASMPGDTARVRVEIFRRYQFKTFLDAIEFMNQVAPKCEFVGHHPRWQNLWRTIDVYLTTLDAGYKISDRDIQLAKAFDQTFSKFPGAEL